MIDENSRVIKMDNLYPQDAYIPNNFQDLKSNIIRYEDKNYLFKYVWDDSVIVNELIGSYLAKLIDLEAVDYKIGILNDRLYILSELFFDDNFDYSYPKYIFNELDCNKISRKLYINNIPEEYPYIREKILKLIILDIKMGQYDRSSYTNLMIKKSKVSNYVDLAPIYDFGLSYPLDLDELLLKIYYNPYITIRKNKASLAMLVSEYPKVKDYINILKDINMPSILTAIENRYKIKVNNNIKDYLYAKDKAYTKVLNKL